MNLQPSANHYLSHKQVAVEIVFFNKPSSNPECLDVRGTGIIPSVIFLCVVNTIQHMYIHAIHEENVLILDDIKQNPYQTESTDMP